MTGDERDNDNDGFRDQATAQPTSPPPSTSQTSDDDDDDRD